MQPNRQAVMTENKLLQNLKTRSLIKMDFDFILFLNYAHVYKRQLLKGGVLET